MVTDTHHNILRLVLVVLAHFVRPTIKNIKTVGHEKQQKINYMRNSRLKLGLQCVNTFLM